MKDSVIASLLEEARTADWNEAALAQKAVALAEKILACSNAELRRGEKFQAAKLARMMNDPAGKAFTISLVDRIFRPSDPVKSAEQFRHLVKGYGIPEYFTPFERFQIKAGVLFSEYMPGVVMPLMTRELRRESDKVILPCEPGKLKSHLKMRKRAGMHVIVNQLGEAVLGESEAQHRLQQILERLREPLCDSVSVKLSSVFSQMNMIAFEETVKHLQERIRILYRAAIEQAVKTDGKPPKPKFVNLDMEEYRDLHVTCEAFKRTLMEEEFMKLEAGIVLQAYLPDSWDEQKKLVEWAAKRIEQGGAPIRIRLVKGANLAMEKVEASSHGWRQAPYETKQMVDANFKRMVHYGLEKSRAEAVRIGVASHNLFDICYAMLLARKNGVEKYVGIEMLEGMVNNQVRVLNEVEKGVTLYAPVVKKEDFRSAISYLVRRLDENTHEENYLHDLFGMAPGSKEWDTQKNRFLQACRDKDSVSDKPNRIQNRQEGIQENLHEGDGFYNEQDTDWALPHNAEWIRGKIAGEQERVLGELPVVVNGRELTTQLCGVGRDPSKSGEESYKFSYVDHELVEEALTCAEKARKDWTAVNITKRAGLLCKVADEIAAARGDLIAAMVRDAGKVPAEGDVEVSEAIDFCRYYSEGLSRPGMLDGLKQEPLGTVCIAPPWNFPCAIPCGSVASALMAGNTVIFKPAPQTVYTAWVLVQAFWKAGIPKEVLQFVPALENEIGRKLIVDPRVNAVMLTGAYATGELFKSWRNDLHLVAETSGKNAIIITAEADLDLAVKDLVRSAFGHAGQKCSAASLGIIEAEVYDNPAFLRQLRDAAASLKTGSSWESDTVVPPLINEPGDDLKRALCELDPGEEWLLKPEMTDGNPYLWSPGIRLGVKPGSWFHKTECFGPVLGLIRADNLEDAIAIQNDSDYGLTGGIQTLDEREIQLWKSKVQVGNAYINRPITGAIVRRQPFGGWKKSSIGPGAKAGGPNYLTLLGKWVEDGLPNQLQTPVDRIGEMLERLGKVLPEQAKRIRAAAGSQAKWWSAEFSVNHDPSAVLGEANIFRYVPEGMVVVRADEGMEDGDIAIIMLAAKLIGAELQISLPAERKWLDGFSGQYATVVIESLEKLTERFEKLAADCRYLRYPGCSPETALKAEQAGLTVLTRNVVANGRIELLSYLSEQAVSETLHRYGNMLPLPGDFNQ